MMRLCVIGNSHIAALKLGWDQLVARGEAPDLRPTFFGAPSDGVRHIRLQEGRLVPKRRDIADHFARMGGSEDIRLADYDAFLLVGLNVSVKRVMRFYKTHAWAGLRGTEGKVIVAPGFARDFLTERYGDTLMGQTVALLQGRPVLALPEPLWAEWIRQGAPETAEYGWDTAIKAGDGPDLGAMFLSSLAPAFPGAKVLPQPPATVAHGITTDNAYNKDASRLISGEGGGTDAAHMNGAFGAAIWPLVRPALEE